jgi:hypothetical protein
MKDTRCSGGTVKQTADAFSVGVGKERIQDDVWSFDFELGNQQI